MLTSEGPTELVVPEHFRVHGWGDVPFLVKVIHSSSFSPSLGNSTTLASDSEQVVADFKANIGFRWRFLNSGLSGSSIV